MTRITVELIEPGAGTRSEVRVNSDDLARDVLRERVRVGDYCICLQGPDDELKRLKGSFTLEQNGVAEGACLRIHPVERTPFVGREAEIRGFREGLRELKQEPSRALPQVLLINGIVGIGKTTLIRQLERVSEEVWEGTRGIYIDWRSEREKSLHRIPDDPVFDLRMSPDRLDPKVVLDVIAKEVGKSNTKHYQEVQEQFKEMTRSFEEARSREALLSESHSEGESQALALIDMLSIGELAVLLRSRGQWLRKSDVSPKLTPEDWCRLARAYINRCIVDTDLRDSFYTQHESFSRALGHDLRLSCDEDGLFLICLDSFDYVHSEMLAQHLFEAAEAAGPRVAWVIASRQDLSNYESPPYLVGASYRLDVEKYSLGGLTPQQIGEYLNTHQYWSLSDGEINSICKVTRGSPQMLEFAVSLWDEGADIGEIIGGAPFKEELMDRFIERIQQDPIECDIIYLLGMLLDRRRKAWLEQDGLLQQVVEERTDDDGLLRIDEVLDEIGWRYPFFRSEDEQEDAAFPFLTEYLREKRSPRCRDLARVASDVVKDRLKSLLDPDVPMYEQWQKEEWAHLALDLIRFSFWISDEEGWGVFVPRFLEVLAYRANWLNELLEILRFFQPRLSWSGSFGERSKSGRADIVGRPEGWADKWDRNALVDTFVELKKQGRLERVVQKGDRHGVLETRWLRSHQDILTWLEGEWYLRRGDYRVGLHLLREARGSLSLQHLPHLLDQFVKSYLLIAQAFAYSSEEMASDDNWMETMAICREVIELDPKAFRAYDIMAATLYRLAQLDITELGAWTQLLSLNIEFAVWKLLGSAYLKLGKLSEAEKAFEEARSLKSEEPQLLIGLSEVHKAKREWDRARECKSRAQSLARGKQIVHLELGNSYFRADKLRRACDDYRRAVRLIPEDEVAYLNLGNAYWLLGREAAAEEAYQQARDINADLMLPCFQLGKIYLKQGEFGKGLDMLKEAGNRGKPSTQLLYWLGTAHYRVGEYVDAREAYRRAVSADDRFALGHYGLGRVQFAQEDFIEAVSSLEKAVDLDPDEGVFHYYLCEAYRALGDRQAVQATCESRIKLDSKFAPFYRCILGDFHLTANPPAYEYAAREYEETLRGLRSRKAMPGRFRWGLLYRRLGEVHYGKREYRKAIRCCGRAMEFEPDDPWSYSYRGLALFSLGCEQRNHDLLQRAIRNLEQAIKLNPESPVLQRYLGAVYLRLQAFTDAEAYYRQAMKLESVREDHLRDPGIRLGIGGVYSLQDSRLATEWFRKVAEIYVTSTSDAMSRCCYVMSRLGMKCEPRIEPEAWKQDLVAVSQSGDHHLLWEWLTLGQMFEEGVLFEERISQLALDRYLMPLYQLSLGHVGDVDDGEHPVLGT